jgi:hypothetical protein
MDVTAGTEKKVWWKCEKNHEWEAQIRHRNNGTGCPYCAGQKVCKETCLSMTHPELSKEWHPAKNGALTPDDVSKGSREKVWWICDKGHEWKVSVGSRSNGTGCPTCYSYRRKLRRKVKIEKSLATLNSELSKEWHPTKNGALTPDDATCGSGEIVWWECEKGHEWEAIIANRNKGTGCPYCSGKKVCKDNCLSFLNPELSKEWHYAKNGALTPDDVTCGSGEIVWWLCKKGHEWEASIYTRNQGYGKCPECRKESRKKK